MKRRNFINASLAASTIAATSLAVSSVAQAASKDSFKLKMTNAYPPGAPFYVQGPGSPVDFCEKVATMSSGRLTIQHFAAGELIPALEGFDAVSSGTIEMNAANAYFWAGKIPAAQYFTTVPFGLNTQGMNAWLLHGGGLDLWHEIYEPYGLIAFPMGNTGVQMTGWFRKPVEGIDDFKGLKMRIPGLAGKVYSELGVSVKLLPGGEIFPALERGVIDAAEFVGPYQDRRLGLHKAAKYYYTTGWHEPTNVTELLINKKVWDKLPEDLQSMVKIAAQSTITDSLAWSESVNADALTDLVENEGVIARPLSANIVAKLKEATFDTLASLAASDPQVKKVHESFMAFRKKHSSWAALSEKPFLNI